MARGDRRHAARRGRYWLLPVVFVLLVLLSAGIVYRLDPRAETTADPARDPAGVAPPAGLDLPPAGASGPVAEPVESTGSVDRAKVRRVLAPFLRDRDLGRHLAVAVTDLGKDATVFDNDAGPTIPASTLKLLTAVAALESLGGDHTFPTTVVSDRPGRVVLVGGGDPFLASRPESGSGAATGYPGRADVVTLARATARELRAEGRTRVNIGYDDHLFTGPDVNPRWRASYIPDAVVAPITPLWVDGGRSADGLGRVADPSFVAAEAFRSALVRQGIRVSGPPERVRTAASATDLAVVRSAPLASIVERVLDVSDNEAAEVLSHQVGLAEGTGGSFTGGAEGVRRVLNRLGIELPGARIYDGSGLSRQDRLHASTLVDVLSAAADRPGLRPAVTGLPVAGFTGSLADRFADGRPAGRGRVRAKTGTLTRVSGLAGVATDRDGNVLAFAFLADRVRVPDTLDAREALDQMAAALGACRCGA